MKKILCITLIAALSMSLITAFAQSRISEELLEIIDINVSQDEVVLECNGMSAFIDVTGYYNDGSTLELGTVARWISTDENVALAYDGRILARNKGKTVITVSDCRQRSAERRIFVAKRLISLIKSDIIKAW